MGEGDSLKGLIRAASKKEEGEAHPAGKKFRMSPRPVKEARVRYYVSRYLNLEVDS